MELMDVIRQRKSVRKYTDQPIERKRIEECVEAARLAPSADNMQPWRFIIIDDPELKKEYVHYVCSGVYRKTQFIQYAPALVVVIAKLNLLVHRMGKLVTRTDIHLIDIGIAGEQLVLRAREMGIGTCWINFFNVKRAGRFLDLSRNHKVISMIAMGYPAEGSTKDRPRLPREKILFFNTSYEKGLR
jgi:nitroreductase